jgi:hypothetical protein
MLAATTSLCQIGPLNSAHRGERMTKLTKTAPQCYVTEEGSKFYGTPQNVWFYAEQPNLRSAVASEQKLNYENEVRNQFTPSGEAFRPIGNREPLAFVIEAPVHRSIFGNVHPGKFLTIGKIGEDGQEKFDGSIWFHVEAAGGEYDLPQCGTVWLAPSDTSPSETLHLSLYMAEEQIEAIYADIIARPNAVLTIRLNFAVYQNEIEARINSTYQTLLLESNAHIPITEAELAVIDNPYGFEKAVSDPDKDGASKPTVPTMVLERSDNSLVLQRLNWVIGLLVLLVLVILFR